MKLLAIADLHDSYSNMDKIAARQNDYEAILMCGDITTTRESAEKFLSMLNTKIFFVPGNGEAPYIEKIYKKAGASIHGNVGKLREYNIAGFGYTPPTPFGTPGELPEDEIRKGLSKLEIGPETIFITHCPPKGILDKGFGSSAIREFVERAKPKLHLFGHIHEVVGIEKVGDTTFINCPPAMRGGAVEIILEENGPLIEFIEL